MRIMPYWERMGTTRSPVLDNCPLFGETEDVSPDVSVIRSFGGRQLRRSALIDGPHVAQNAHGVLLDHPARQRLPVKDRVNAEHVPRPDGQTGAVPGGSGVSSKLVTGVAK